MTRQQRLVGGRGRELKCPLLCKMLYNTGIHKNGKSKSLYSVTMLVLNCFKILKYNLCHLFMYCMPLVDFTQ